MYRTRAQCFVGGTSISHKACRILNLVAHLHEISYYHNRGSHANRFRSFSSVLWSTENAKMAKTGKPRTEKKGGCRIHFRFCRDVVWRLVVCLEPSAKNLYLASISSHSCDSVCFKPIIG